LALAMAAAGHGDLPKRLRERQLAKRTPGEEQGKDAKEPRTTGILPPASFR
jgi:hypothetical protein